MAIKNGKLKGFIFTLDAIFALVVASVGVSLLLYVSFTSPGAYSDTTSQAYGIMQSMLQTTIGQAAPGSAYLNYLALPSNASTSSWPQLGHDAQLSSATAYSLRTPYLLYTFNTTSDMLPSVVVQGGFAFAAAGNSISMINATNGRLISVFPAGGSASNVVSTPAVYKNILLYANSSMYVMGVNIYSNSMQWNVMVTNSITTPMEIENNYLSFGTANGFYLLNIMNGTVAAYAALPSQAQTPLYTNGEYLVSTTSQSSQDYLYSYALYWDTLTNIWKVPLDSPQTTAPTTTGNTVGVGSGSSIYIFTIGGNLVSNTPVGSQVLGISAYGNNYYVQTSQNLYEFNSSGGEIYSTSTEATAQNSIPSVSPSVIYTISKGNLFDGYSATLSPLWNISLPSAYVNLNYTNIALAYGNAYVPNGNTLYVFGTYKTQINNNILQTLSNMYLNGQGSYANYLLGSVYNSSTTGIFINSTYAPDLEIASFNGANSFISTGSTGLPVGSAARSVFIWTYYKGPYSSVDAAYTYGTWIAGELSSIEIFDSNIVFNAAGGQSFTSSFAPPNDTWQFIGYTYAAGSNQITIYDNGQSQTGALIGPLNTVLPSANQSVISGRSGTSLHGDPYWNGLLSDLQVYNTSLSKQQVIQLYQNGPFGLPVNMQDIKLWIPLNGNPNDLSGSFNNGLQSVNVNYTYSNLRPQSLVNAYQVSKASVPLSLSSNGISKWYNVSVVTWR